MNIKHCRSICTHIFLSTCIFNMFMHVFVYLKAKPYFLHGIGNRLVDEGQTVVWRCMAVARPEVQYTWYKNGEVILNQPDAIQIERNRLIIHNVQVGKDEGMYQCGATNIHGTTFSYGQLKVLCMYYINDINHVVSVCIESLNMYHS